jgi:glutamate/tyrosine decarboxylase-like PLP-dependent enzyme
MNQRLEQDLSDLDGVLDAVLDEVKTVLHGLEDRPVARAATPQPLPSSLTSVLPDAGLGTIKTLKVFKQQVAPRLTGSAGPRYLGFVTGGTTPAALVGDWLTSTFDQNAADPHDGTQTLERQTINMLRDLFGLSDAHTGSFVSGATMSNFVGLAQARQWVGRQRGLDVARDGLSGPPIPVLSAAPHSSTFKALSMLGMGRSSLYVVPMLPGREAVDVNALRDALEAMNQPCIVVASSGTVNTTDFDDLTAIAALRQEFPFWLHVDAAFGGFAAVSPRFAHLTDGLDAADSITVDAHKWLNVPYDSAMQFTRHRDLQLEVFANVGASYLGAIANPPQFVHLTPENSRRFRALPAWFSLLAYGRDDYQEMIEQNCALAAELGTRLEAHPRFQLLAPVRLNVACFTLEDADTPSVTAFLSRVRESGEVFLTPTTLNGVPAVRAAFSNWRTTRYDLERVWNVLAGAVG